MKDILFIFLVCLVLMVLVNQHPKPETLSYNSPFPALSAPSPPKQKIKKVFLRQFEWVDPAKTKRMTSFYIPEKELKSEIRKFGTLRASTHPLFMERKGFKVVGRKTFYSNNRIQERMITVVDYKKIFKRNLAHFHSLTPLLTATSGLSENADPLHSFLTFVQHIRYQLPPYKYKGRFINSFFVPLVCLYEQYGDCDSKSILLAEFLCTAKAALNAPKGKGEKAAMVLIRGNGLSHAVLAVKRKVLPGMTSLFDVKKGSFILLETTRPGWAPGFISSRVMDAVKSGLFQFVELN